MTRDIEAEWRAALQRYEAAAARHEDALRRIGEVVAECRALLDDIARMQAERAREGERR